LGLFQVPKPSTGISKPLFKVSLVVVAILLKKYRIESGRKLWIATGSNKQKRQTGFGGSPTTKSLSLSIEIGVG
jgi:hypothetical protein